MLTLPASEVDLLLIGGLQGAGKSSLAIDWFPDRRRVNRDEIRCFHKQMTTQKPWRPQDWCQEVEPLITEIEMAVIRHELQSGRPVVVDNTHITTELRRPYIDLARSLGKSVGCLFLAPPVDLCLDRNRRRERCVPEDVVRAFQSSMTLPRSEEGLDFIQILDQPVPRR